jgi:biopolymer transport protein ExbB
MNINIVERSKLALLEVGASPILYLMLGLSVASVALVIERLIFFLRTREDLQGLAERLSARLAVSDLTGAKALVTGQSSAEAAVVAAGLGVISKGSAAVEEAMSGARAIQKMRLERRLGFLGTLGSNAPFVGLLGTVIGIVQAFEQLERAGAATGGGAMSGVMGAIAEALVATAIGLLVAIPAVAAFNAFQRRIKTVLGNTEALTHIVLTHVKAMEPAGPARGSFDSARQMPQSSDDSGLLRFERASVHN